MSKAPLPTLRQWLQAEPFTLTMSAGFFSFFAHSGMLSVLEEENLRPQRVTGASAGALVGACWAAGRSVDELKEHLFALQKDDFWEPGFGLGLLRGAPIKALIETVCPVKRLEDCPIPITVSVFDALSLSTHTLSHGTLAEAVYASCAMPPLWHPQPLNGRLYWDGGVRDRHGLAGTQPGERVFYHHIATRSPWRRANSAGLRVPARFNLTALAIHGLPRATPDKMELGPVVFDLAREATQLALDQTLHEATVHIYARERLFDNM